MKTLKAYLVFRKGQKLLGVLKLSKGTGAAMSEATIASLVEWETKEQVIRMCFDTFSSNSGVHTGACTLIEKLFQKELLYLLYTKFGYHMFCF